MAPEKATALVLRTTDWSETSRIATLWTRELGKVRALAKGGRRLRSSFENALDLLTLCSIVLLRKSSGGLDLLTEAQVIQRFPGLTLHLPALYGAYYVAEGLATGSYFAVTYNDYGYVNEIYDNIPCTGYCDPTTGTAIPVTVSTSTRGINFALVAN